MSSFIDYILVYVGLELWRDLLHMCTIKLDLIDVHV